MPLPMWLDNLKTKYKNGMDEWPTKSWIVTIILATAIAYFLIDRYMI